MSQNKTMSLEVDQDWSLVAEWDEPSNGYVLFLSHSKGFYHALPFYPCDMGDMQAALEMLEAGREYLPTEGYY